MSDTTPTAVDPATTRPFYRHIGLRSEPAPAPGTSIVHLATQPDIANSHGDIHGGAIMSLLDAAMGIAARTLLSEGQGVTTVSMSVNFVTAGGGDLVARGRVVRQGRSIASTEAFAEDAKGRVVAHALGTMRIVDTRSGRSDAKAKA
ncbi:PaaI family thioesterase [Bosea sp. (in: a-proteobacteria)]|uniref:PaaI family thioesterase n=1 Tax=Bosea sp. (in: a-proteobacteria) TaxID=1871050 RepID=UPI002627EBAD|nr:PaaI family thioesterase [Bosea sp. (in: a-proteobacteria)]MCO5089592.1 PaaI family thioesterase [Bosea sp. (in: a-proteobacteria)]